MKSREEYVYATKEEIGRPVEEIIPAVTEVLQARPSLSCTGPTAPLGCRPVHTLTVLLDEQAFDLEILGHQSGRTRSGTPFLGQETEIAQFL